MANVIFYRDEKLPFFEIKSCDTKKLSYKKHSHEEYSLALVEKGTSVLWCNGKNIPVNSQSVVFIPSEVLHSCNPDDAQEWKYIMIFIQPEWLQSVLELQKDCHKFEFKIEEPYIIYKQYTQMYRLIKCLTSKVSPLEKETHMITTIDRLLKYENSECVPIDSSVYGGRNLQIIEDYLQDNFSENIKLDTLSQISGLSKYYLIRLFKSKHRIPPHTYQILLRINFAKREIKKQRIISEVAQDAGFYDQSHFTKLFRHYVGATPEVYQKSINL